MDSIKPSKPKSLKLNIIFNFIYQVFVLIVPFITSPYVSRKLLPDGIGSYSFASSLVSYFALVAAFGFLDYGTTMIAKHRENEEEYSKIFWEICFAKLCLALGVFAVYSGLILGNVFNNADYPLNTKIVFLLLGCNIIVNGMDATFLFQGLEDFGPLCLRNFFIRLLNMIMIFVLVRSKNDYIYYIAIMGISNLLIGPCSFIGLNKKIRRPHLGNPHLWKHFSKAFIYFIPTAALTVLPLISKTFIGFMVKDSDASGYYEQADKLITLAVTMINSIDAIMMSRMTYLYSTGNIEEIQAKTKHTLELYFLFAIPAFLGLLLINPYFTVGFFGDEYQASVSLVYILSFKILFMPLTALLGAIYFVPKGYIWRRNIFYIVGLAIGIGLNAILIYFYGIVGACIANVITEALLAITFVVASKSGIRFSMASDTFIKAFDSGLIMIIIGFLVCKVIGSRFSPMIVSIVVLIPCVIVYFGMLILIKEDMVHFYATVCFDKTKKILRKIRRK